MSGMLVTAVDVVDESYDSKWMVNRAEDATGVRVPLTLAAPVTSPASTWRSSTVEVSR